MWSSGWPGELSPFALELIEKVPGRDTAIVILAAGDSTANEVIVEVTPVDTEVALIEPHTTNAIGHAVGMNPPILRRTFKKVRHLVVSPLRQ